MGVSQIIFQSWPTKDHFSLNFWTTVFLNGNMLEKYVIDKTRKNNIYIKIKNFICLDGYMSVIQNVPWQFQIFFSGLKQYI